MSAQASWAALDLESRTAVLQEACQRAQESIDLDATSALLTREHGKILVESLFDLAATAAMVGSLAPLVAEAAGGPEGG